VGRPRSRNGAPRPDKTLLDSTSGESERRPPERSRIAQGTAIDRYVVLYELGSGGMGVVYAAYDPELDRKLALKLLHPKSGSSTAPQRLLREAKAIAQLKHPNVITVHDVGTFEGRVYVAMEFIGGVTLRQWVQQEERSWREVVAVLRRAGEGLAAAHAAGLVHRDFKPDNVMVEPGGRVVVLDFGLVRRAHSRHDDDAPVSSEESPGRELVTDHLGEELTRGGAKLGTPAYMAPEQQLREPADARSDQFSFCIVLWEALYGVRPFTGENATATAMRIVHGEITEPPRGSKVPTWLRKVLLRGLSTDPRERYATMGALLGELARDRDRDRRRMFTMGGLGVVLAGVIGLAFARRDEDPCAGGLERWAGRWDDERKGEIATAFARTGTSYGGVAAAGVERVLDGYAEEWAAAYRDACEATRVRHEQSAEREGKRMACLDRRISAAGALVDELLQADATVVEHAVEAVNALPAIRDCSDVAALSADAALPASDTTRQRVRELRDALADARAKESAARYDQALLVVGDVLAQAESLAYLPLVAEARLTRAQIRERLGDFVAAEEDLLEAIWAAQRSRHEWVEAEAWVQLVWVAGVERMQTDTGHVWASFAEAALERVGRPEILAATLTHNIAGIHYREMRLDEALTGYQRALADQRRLLGEDNPQVAMTLNHIGNVLIEQGQFASAREFCEQSLAERRRILGARHPRVAASLNNLAELARKQEDPEASLAFARQSLDIVGDTGGPEERVALVLATMALLRLESFDKAVPLQERIVAIDGIASGRRPDRLAGSLRELGRIRTAAGLPAAAAEAYERAITVDPEPQSRGVAEALVGLAQARRDLGETASARAAIERAAPLLDRLSPRATDLDTRLTELDTDLAAP
jgi:tetratricopeptide (TPR) repeat protein